MATVVKDSRLQRWQQEVCHQVRDVLFFHSGIIKKTICWQSTHLKEDISVLQLKYRNTSYLTAQNMWELLRIKMQKKSGQAAVEFKTSQFCLVNSELRSAYFHTTRLLQCENLANFTWKDWILLLVQNRKNLYSIRHGLPMKHLSI